MIINDHVNRNELAERLDHDMILLRELVNLFASDSCLVLDRIRSAIERGDSAALRKEAHTLKGSVSNFSARQAYEIALQLENAGKAGDLSGSLEIFNILATEIQKVRDALIILIAENEL